MLTNFDLLDYAQKMGLKLIGVYSKDELKKKKKDGAYIINMMNSDAGNGSHWTCFYIVNGTSYYFDSFGIIPPVEVIRFCGKPIIYNEKEIQNLKSGNCGWFCLVVLKYIQDNPSMEAFNDILNAFDDETSKNDQILQNIINRNFQ